MIDGDDAAVSPAGTGTKLATWTRWTVPPGQSARSDLVLSAEPLDRPFTRREAVFSARRAEVNHFYEGLLPEGSALRIGAHRARGDFQGQTS